MCGRHDPKTAESARICAARASFSLDRLKQVATAAAALLLSCHTAAPVHESARSIIVLQINNHSCSVLCWSESVYPSFIYSLHSRCRVSRLRQLRAFHCARADSFGPMGVSTRERNVIRPHPPACSVTVQKYAADGMANDHT